MPTTRHRYQITETSAVAHAIEVAAQRWPDLPPSQLLLRLVDIGATTLAEQHDDAIRQRRIAVEATSGKYADVFEKGYLAALREDWPE